MFGKAKDNKAEGVEHANGAAAGAAPKAGFKARMGAHCKRFWWLHLIIFCIVVLVVVLPVIYVGYPNMAQDDVNESTLTVNAMSISEPRPDGLHLKVTQEIGSSSSFHPWLDSFEADLTLEGSETPFATLDVPRVKAHDGVISKIDQDLTIPDLDAFTEYSKAVMHQENIVFNVYGKTGLKLGALPKTTVTYDHDVTMTALNGLAGLNVTDTKVIMPAEDDGTNLRGNVIIPNPSVMTIEMGNLTLNLAVDGTAIGTSYLQNVLVKPGDNTIAMTAIVNQSTIIGIVADKYQDGMVPIQISGNSSVYNGEEIPYFSAALASNELTVEMNLIEALSG